VIVVRDSQSDADPIVGEGVESIGGHVFGRVEIRELGEASSLVFAEAVTISS
jgi:hypothetical protein